MSSLVEAIRILHNTFHTPHILITSVTFPSPGSAPSLSVVGSTITSTNTPRIFQIQVPSLDCFFSGTGDMFAALMVVRLREAVVEVEGLSKMDAWISDDSVAPTDLPLARAAERALASMQEVLRRTMDFRDAEVKKIESMALDEMEDVNGNSDADEKEKEEEQRSRHLKMTRAAEVRLVRNLDCLRKPVVKFRAEKVDF
jgi:pyridoxine kinase